MKRALLIGLLILGGIGLIVFLGHIGSPPKKTVTTRVTPTAQPGIIVVAPSPIVQITPTPKPIISIRPKALSSAYIEIPKIKIAANLESVGKDKNGAMEVPKQVNDVALYNLGPNPGQIGNVVVSGHKDYFGVPQAVFFNLNRLQVGDTITVTFNGKKYTYIVRDKQSFPFDKFPLESVFGPSTKANLNLVTCGGKYNKLTQNYSERLVVFAELLK